MHTIGIIKSTRATCMIMYSDLCNNCPNYTTTSILPLLKTVNKDKNKLCIFEILWHSTKVKLCLKSQ